MDGFSYLNSRGILYYLRKKMVTMKSGRQIELMFFSKEKENSIPLPSGYEIKENSKNGLPVLKKTFK